MTDKTTEALKMAEEALDKAESVYEAVRTHPIAIQQVQKALAAIREALAEQEKQEPVAVISESAIGLVKLHANGVSLPFDTPLYAALVSVEAAVLAEREACAEVCDRFAENEAGYVAEDCAAAIRARGEK